MRYKDCGWLNDQYTEHGYSTLTLAKAQHCSIEAIRQSLIRCSIPRRPAARVNRVCLSQALLEQLEGSLLGDGSILLSKGGSTSSARYSLTSKYQSYLQYVSAQLSSLGLQQSGVLHSHANSSGHYWRYHSHYYRDLTALRAKWYPDGHKHVPDDLSLSPQIALRWFLEDGHFTALNDQLVGRVQFATNAFPKQEVEFLASLLREALDRDPIHVNKGSSGSFTIVFSEKGTVEAFYDYIGPCPIELVPIFGYKWPAIADKSIRELALENRLRIQDLEVMC